MHGISFFGELSRPFNFLTVTQNAAFLNSFFFFKNLEFRSVDSWMKFIFFFGAKDVLSTIVSHVLLVTRFFFLIVLSSRLSHRSRIFTIVNEEFFFLCVWHAHISSPSPFVRAQAFGLFESTQYGLEDLSCVAMPPPSKRLHEVKSWSSGSNASAPKRIRGSAGRAGFEADPVTNSHCFTWQNASLKKPDDDNKRYPW